MQVVFWGTYDTGKPRTRLLIRGLREKGVGLTECHYALWEGVEDKSQIPDFRRWVRLGLRWILSYPRLLSKYMMLGKHDAVIIGYPGFLDVLVLWPFARLRGVPVLWDAFIMLYDTVVEDRKLIGSRHPLAQLLFLMEWAACRAADRVLLDTHAQAGYLVKVFSIAPIKVGRVLVGTETDVFHSDSFEKERIEEPNARPFTVLFYGQFIPLHGVEVIVKAAKLTEKEGFRWVLIGKGQESGKIKMLVEKLRPANIEWTDWVPYQELPKWIGRADVCLGIFGDTDKAKRVIPNKVFQVLATGRPIITGDTPAMRELSLPSGRVTLVPPNDPEALAGAAREMCERLVSHGAHRDALAPYAVGAAEVGNQLLLEISKTR